MAPDCQYQFSTGCDALKWPGGEDTSYVPRPKVGRVPYGVNPIYKCTVRNTVALTYDDGPNVYTSDLLDILDSYGAKATFFINAINSNKGQIDDEEYPWADIVRRMYDSGHQVASHTWSHQDLDKMPSNLRRDQMVKNEMAIRNILGVFPTYMRPPYSSCSGPTGCLADMDYLGYHVAYFNVDTDDYNNDSPNYIQRSKDIFDNAVSMHESVGWPLLAIAHDVHEQTVYNLTAHMLQTAYSAGYHPVTLGECLGDPKPNWYRGSGPDKGRREVSKDGRCGGGITCLGSPFGNCCSGNGWCGSSPGHCGSGCQWSFGTCDGIAGSPDGYDGPGDAYDYDQETGHDSESGSNDEHDEKPKFDDESDHESNEDEQNEEDSHDEDSYGEDYHGEESSHEGDENDHDGNESDGADGDTDVENNVDSDHGEDEAESDHSEDEAEDYDGEDSDNDRDHAEGEYD